MNTVSQKIHRKTIDKTEQKKENGVLLKRNMHHLISTESSGGRVLDTKAPNWPWLPEKIFPKLLLNGENPNSLVYDITHETGVQLYT